VGKLGAVRGELGDLLVVLGEDDAALGVTQDVDGVLRVGARVDRGRGTSGAHHREVREDPLVARAGRDADALLGLDAQRDQARGERLDLVAGLLPGDGLPRLATREAEGLGVRGRGDAVEELDSDVGRHGVEEGRVDGGRHLLPTHSSERGATAPHSGASWKTWAVT
jgi:hypothetical protein